MTPKLYNELADWWQLLSPRSEYSEEAEVYRRYLATGWEGSAPPTLLELGCGGGNNASFLKQWFRVTLTDISPAMLAQSRLINPECEHVQGDMRHLRLDRVFDRIFVQDAICYMATPDDLYRAVQTAFVHCRPGGVALFAPDYVRETFSPGTEHGGHDGPGRSLRYLEWTWDPDPADTQYTVDLFYALRDSAGAVRVEHDRHIEGIFPRAEWLRILRDAGFDPRGESFHHTGIDRPLDLFLGFKRSKQALCGNST